jgi:hypothetical protein
MTVPDHALWELGELSFEEPKRGWMRVDSRVDEKNELSGCRSEAGSTRAEPSAIFLPDDDQGWHSLIGREDGGGFIGRSIIDDDDFDIVPIGMGDRRSKVFERLR